MRVKFLAPLIMLAACSAPPVKEGTGFVSRSEYLTVCIAGSDAEREKVIEDCREQTALELMQFRADLEHFRHGHNRKALIQRDEIHLTMAKSMFAHFFPGKILAEETEAASLKLVYSLRRDNLKNQIERIALPVEIVEELKKERQNADTVYW